MREAARGQRFREPCAQHREIRSIRSGIRAAGGAGRRGCSRLPDRISPRCRFLHVEQVFQEKRVGTAVEAPQRLVGEIRRVSGDHAGTDIPVPRGEHIGGARLLRPRAFAVQGRPVMQGTAHLRAVLPQALQRPPLGEGERGFGRKNIRDRIDGICSHKDADSASAGRTACHMQMSLQGRDGRHRLAARRL